MRDRSAINYRMRLATQLGSTNAAFNLQDFVEIHAPRLDPSVDVPRTWAEFITLARKMDALSIAEGRERYGDIPDAAQVELTRLATWLLGEHGVAEKISFEDFRYRWE